jgi:hypothetical protein
MNRAERKGVLFAVLAAYVGGAIVVAATASPPAGPVRAALFPGVLYLEALGALVEFARIAAVGPAAMNAVYAAVAFVAWCAGAYLVGVRAVGVARGELKAMALAYPGVVGILASVGLLAAGIAGAAGLVSGGPEWLPFAALALFGAALWVPALVWLSKVRTATFGWQSRALEHADVAVELPAYLVLTVGLALAMVAVAMDVGPQYLVLTVMGLGVVVVTVVVPTGGTSGSDVAY